MMIRPTFRTARPHTTSADTAPRGRLTRRSLLAGLAGGLATTMATTMPTGAMAQGLERSLIPPMRPDMRGGRVFTDIEEVVAGASLDGQTSLAVTDLTTGRMLESRNAATGLPPASVAKTVTALYALDTLGGDFRFRTRVLATGPITNGRLEGDLVLVGSGDPALDTNALADLAAQVKDSGLVEVAGRYHYFSAGIAETRAIDAAQPDHLGYNPGVSGLNLNYNRVHFEWSLSGSNYTVTMEARTDRYSPGVSTATMMVENRESPVYRYRDVDGIDTWTVARTALGRSGARWLPVKRPAAYTADVFATLMRANGIVLDTPTALATAPAEDGARELASFASERLEDTVEAMLHYSNNLTAEVLGLTASRARGVAATTLEQSAAAMSAWATREFGLGPVALVDHSGLSDASRIATGDLVAMLTSPRARALMRPLLKSIPIPEADARTAGQPDPEVHAKTGTLFFASGLAGYIQTDEGVELAFAIVSADVARRESLSRAQLELPPGGRSWSGRARALQRRLILRWTDMATYGDG